MKIDMHLHTHYSSDGLTKPETMVKRAKQVGLTAIAITDHNTVAAWPKLAPLAKKEGILLVKGEEIKVKHNGKTAGEVLGYFMNSEVKPGSLEEVFDALKQQGALISIAHPFDIFRNNFKHLEEGAKLADAIEVFNARSVSRRFNKKAKAYAESKSMPFTAGSDGHHPREIGKAFIECNAQSEEELRKAILKKKVEVKGELSHFLVHTYTTIAKLNLMQPV